MSQSHSIETHCPYGSGAALRPSLIMGLIYAIEAWFSRRRAYQDLSELDARMLDDVRISSEQVRQLGKPPWWP
jgi:uncharacterized protein YjiS (DUF1127 family)